MDFRNTPSQREGQKASFYVWFLGSEESRGGNLGIWPALRQLLLKERESEPVKVTIQVTSRGLNILRGLGRSQPENSTQFISRQALGSVSQGPLPDDDIVVCLLLPNNPLTPGATAKTPAQILAYRCDSPETAQLLCRQLGSLCPETLIRIPETLGSDGKSTKDDSESSGSERGDDHVAGLWASLAAELRDKLRRREPILLPPRDYDTMHRQRGRVTGLELRHKTQLGLLEEENDSLRRTDSALARPSPGVVEKSPPKQSLWDDQPLRPPYRVPRIRPTPYRELPAEQRHPGLDRDTACPPGPIFVSESRSQMKPLSESRSQIKPLSESRSQPIKPQFKYDPRSQPPVGYSLNPQGIRSAYPGMVHVAKPIQRHQ